ncbi:MAG: zinc ABC transporter substrate-binding protein [Syntrophaceae bacterium]|nr:zinc ABC transporter substrate-binding protein [Syntrophaceae bacterium]
MKRKIDIWEWILSILFLTLISPNLAWAKDRVIVAVTILPQAYFVERIGGQHVDVRVIVPAGAVPATYEPTPQQLFDLSSSKLYIKVGPPQLSVENRFQRFISDTNKNIYIVDMSQGIKNLKEDPHIWLSPSIVRSAAANICESLSSVDPSHADLYRENLQHFLVDIAQLDQRIEQRLHNRKGQCFMVYHPAWGYFAGEYGLKQLAIQEEGKPLNVSRLQKMINLARTKGIKTIFIQKGFDKKSAASIAREIDGKVVEVNPLEQDWLKNLDDFSQVLQDTLRP